MKEKQRIDVLLVEQGFYPSREKARAAVMAGVVQVGGLRVDKAGEKVDKDALIHVQREVHPYVSRGGLKLEKALSVFQVDLTERVVMDVGASTGGFTDCALENGAREVYAIDVGYGQLAWSLRQDSRVHILERTNVRHLTQEMLSGGEPTVAVMDVSFISIRLILPVLTRVLKRPADVVSLIKPQFEAGREQVGKRGVVRDPSVHESVLVSVLTSAQEMGYAVLGLTYSPITGGDGNIEFLAHLSLSPAASPPESSSLLDAPSLERWSVQVVEEAHKAFTKAKEDTPVDNGRPDRE